MEVGFGFKPATAINSFAVANIKRAHRGSHPHRWGGSDRQGDSWILDLEPNSGSTLSTLTLFPTYAPAVERDLFLLGYRNLRAHIVGHVSLSFLVAAGAWIAAPHARVLAWLGWMLALALVFGLGFWLFRQRAAMTTINAQDLVQWKRMHLFMVTWPGLGWGSIGFLFVPDAQLNNLMVMTAFAGALAYSAVSNAHDLRGFVVSVTLASLLLLSQLPAAFGDHAWAASGMCLLYLSVMAWVARNAHLTLIESIELRLANEQLAQRNAEIASRAEKANRDKSEFLAAASHDLRQPVHALLLLVEAYRQQVPAASTHPLMQQIAQAGHAINSLFNSLMELSRLESGSEKVQLVDFRLVPWLKLALERAQPQAQAVGLALRSFVASGVGNAVAHTDQVLLGRVLGNLLGNALRYTPRGGVLLALRHAHGSAGLWLEVWDTGIGIPQTDQARIFDPYVQIDNRERDRSKGLGLGLAIVKRATELLGLTVTVRSVPGRGTRFRVTLPGGVFTLQGSRHESGASALTTPVQEARPASWLVGRRVLLIDDDAMVMAAMLALLSGWGLDLRTATRGDLTAFDACPPGWEPECVLCDFRLPGPMNGIAVLEALQQRYARVVGVLLSGEMVQSVQQDAEDAGFLLLSKPVDAGALMSLLTTLLERRSENRSS